MLERKSKIALKYSQHKQTIRKKETYIVTYENAIGRINSTKQNQRNNYIERRLDNNENEHCKFTQEKLMVVYVSLANCSASC